MKVKFRSVFSFLIIFIELLECDFFIEFPISILANYNFKYVVIGTLSIVLFMVCVTNQKIMNSIDPEVIMIKKPLVCTFIGLFVAIIYSLIVGASLNVIIINAMPYMQFLLTIPLIYILHGAKSRKSFMQLFVFVVMLSLLIRTIATLNYSMNHIIPNATLLIPNGGVKIRYGILKIYPTSIGALVVILLFAYGVSGAENSKWKKNVLIIVSLLGYLYFALLYQARLWTIFLLVVFGVIILCKYDSASKKFLSFLIVALFVVYLFVSGMAMEFFASFTSGSQYWHSTQIRLEGLGTLLTEIVSHPFGNGFSNEFINNGVSYYPDDFLVLQSFYRFGFFAIPIYISYSKFCIRTLKNCKNSKYDALQIGLGLFMLVGCLVFGVFVTRRLFGLPIAFALMAHYTNVAKNSTTACNI